MDVRVTPARGLVGGERRVPASKSLHQRALLLAALAGGSARVHARGGEAGDDVRRLAAALDALGPWTEGALGRTRERLRLDLGRGATGLRFMLAAACLRPEGARSLVTGHVSLLRRPHGPLLAALRRLGGRLKRRRSGSVRVLGSRLGGRRLSLPARVSSQYASALLLVAPRIGGLELRFPDRPVSRPYLDLTLEVLRAFGVPVRARGLDGPGGEIAVAEAVPSAADYEVEADASCAAPWWAAAALTGGEVWVPGLPADTRQADAALLPVLERMGAAVTRAPDGTVRVRGPGERLGAPGDVDLRDAPDLILLVSALAGHAVGRTRIQGAGHARFKESDRLASAAAALAALGGRAAIEGEDLVVEGNDLRGGVVDVAGDHRVALAFGVLGLVVPGVVLRGAEAVAKSYPAFLAELEEAAAGGPSSSGQG